MEAEVVRVIGVVEAPLRLEVILPQLKPRPRRKSTIYIVKEFTLIIKNKIIALKTIRINPREAVPLYLLTIIVLAYKLFTLAIVLRMTKSNLRLRLKKATN